MNHPWFKLALIAIASSMWASTLSAQCFLLNDIDNICQAQNFEYVRREIDIQDDLLGRIERRKVDIHCPNRFGTQPTGQIPLVILMHGGGNPKFHTIVARFRSVC